MLDILSEIVFLIQRVNWLTVIDLLLVTIIFYVILLMLRDTQAQTLMRGVFFVIIAISLLTTLVNLPAFSWLVKTTLPALLFAIPVIFMPELRRGLERLGRAGSDALFQQHPLMEEDVASQTIKSIVSAVARLSTYKQGALIVMQRQDILVEYEETGVKLEAKVTPELLMQIFYPNTPLHDGAVIIVEDRISAAACVLPLSASGVLNSSPVRQMGLRHRAALGISEATDAIAVVVSEETGSISLAHRGRLMRRLSAEKIENILLAFYKRPELAEEGSAVEKWIKRIFGFHNEGEV